GADRKVGEQDAGEPGSRGSVERVGSGGKNRIEVTEKDDRNRGSHAPDEIEQAIEPHAQLERALRACLYDRSVGHRIGERQAKLNEVSPRLPERVDQLRRALRVGMARGDVRNQCATPRRAQLREAAFDTTLMRYVRQAVHSLG